MYKYVLNNYNGTMYIIYIFPLKKIHHLQIAVDHFFFFLDYASPSPSPQKT